MQQLKKFFSTKLGFAVGAFLGISSAAIATTTLYEYKDNAGNLFHIQIFECGSSYCTGMVQEDSSGNEKGVSANPISTIEVPSAASSNGLLPATSSSLSANQVVKSSAGNLYSFEVSADSTLSAAAWWIMIYNATSAPADGSVTPAKCYAVPPGTTSYAAAWHI